MWEVCNSGPTRPFQVKLMIFSTKISYLFKVNNAFLDSSTSFCAFTTSLLLIFCFSLNCCNSSMTSFTICKKFSSSYIEKNVIFLNIEMSQLLNRFFTRLSNEGCQIQINGNIKISDFAVIINFSNMQMSTWNFTQQFQ